MFVHRSNRTEKLAAALSEVLRSPLASPLAPEVIVVSSQGMERWLAQHLATTLGVCSNTRFPFPRAFIDELLGVPLDSASRAFARESLLWTIAARLPEMARHDGADALRAYLVDDTDSRKRFELSRQIAHVFDQYVVYRPELVRAWERGAGRGWQPDLWRSIVAAHGSSHLASRAARFLEEPLPDFVPERVCVFGASALPPIYVRILARLARERAVHVFLLTPSPDVERRHALTRSFGTLGRDFDRHLLEAAEHAVVDDLFVEPGEKTLLEALQSDLLRGDTDPVKASRAHVKANDLSIAVHSSHGPLREVEILRDNLLDLFEKDPTLEPEDVIVMAPDIDDYAPLIDSVFGVDPGVPGFIPYRIADRRIRDSNAVAETLLSVLDLAGGRMRASDVLDLLQLEPVRDHFGIVAEALPDVQRLVQSAGIRWGIDRAHRAQLGQPDRDENTFRFGLNRLLLGQAMGTDAPPFRGVVPAGGENAETGELVGKLSELATRLFSWSDALSTPRTVPEWRVVLHELLGAFVTTEEPRLAAVRAVRAAVDALAESAAAAGFSETVRKEAVLLLLGKALDSERASHGFLTGGTTFCALLPMRSIPFRVVCLLGLNDAKFPRTDRAPVFDLVAHQPEPGDRSSREEDRQLFLEALLSARQRLILSYVGRALHDNAPFPPSVVVAGLLDVIDASFGGARPREAQLALFADRAKAPAGAGQRLVVEHPLQPFSQRYFGADPDPRLFSYVATDAEGARALSSRSAKIPRFHVAPLLEATEDLLDVEELARFLENPARGLVQRRLGVVLDDRVAFVSDRDALELEPLEMYEVGARLFTDSLRGQPEELARDIARGLGLLPLGTPGEVDAARVLREVRALRRLCEKWLDGGRVRPFEPRITLGGTKLAGVLRDMYPKAQVFARFARLKARNELGAWVRHLALCAGTRGEIPRPTVVLGRATAGGGVSAEARIFAPLSESTAKQHLAELVRIYRAGQKTPICFFPAASRKFVEVFVASENRSDRAEFALEQAGKTYVDGRKAGADAEDAYVRRVFENENPFDLHRVPFDADGTLGIPGFADLALAVFLPLMSNSTTERA